MAHKSQPVRNWRPLVLSTDHDTRWLVVQSQCAGVCGKRAVGAWFGPFIFIYCWNEKNTWGVYFHYLFVFTVWCRSIGQMIRYVLSTMFVNIVYRSLTCVARTKLLSWGPGAKSSSFICTYVAAQIKMGTKLILSIRVCSNGSWGLGPFQTPMGNSRSTSLFYWVCFGLERDLFCTLQQW
jgi:hypothetical protein